MKYNPRLWIFGDSWSTLSTTDPATVWTRQLAQKLSSAIDSPVMLHNASLIGSSQDWAITEYCKVMDQIKPEDYVVFVLTSAARVWYFEDRPSVSNWNILDFDEVVGKERAQAVEGYIRHIQRPMMDELYVYGRMSILAHETQRRGLRRPLVVKGFWQELGGARDYEILNVCLGDLAAIQRDECQNQELLEKLLDKGVAGYFKGADCRYNHLCLCNHDILSDKLVEGLVNDTTVDLTSGFIKDIIAPDWHRDEDFCREQLDPNMVDHFKKEIMNKAHTPGWQIRTGIDKVMHGFKYQS